MSTHRSSRLAPSRAADELPAVERTPGGNDLSLLREMLALTPQQRIERNVQWLAMVEALRSGLVESRGGSEPDLSTPR